MTTGIGILFVNGGGEHADGAQEQLAIFGGGLLQALDVLFDVAGHVIEGFGKLADFPGAFDSDAFVKFGAADGAHGFHQAANGARDAEGEKISEEQGDESDAHDEAERLRGEFFDAGVNTRAIEAALGDDGPAQFRNGAVGADHFDRMIVLVLLDEMHRFGGAQFLRQFFQVVDDGRTGSDVAAGNDFGRIGVRDDVAVAIYDEDSAFAHASIADAFEQAVNRDDRGDHAGKLAVQRERNGNDERRAIIFSEREGFADKGQSLNAGREGAFERAADERILIGVETARGLAFGEFVDGGDVQNVLIIFDEALQQSARAAARAWGRPHFQSSR